MDVYQKTLNLIREHAPPEFAEAWYNEISAAIERGTVTQPFGCLTVTNGEVSLAKTNVPAGSSRSSSL